MGHWIGLVCVLTLGVGPVVGCGDDAETLAQELFGTWVFLNAEENDGTSWGEDCATDCPTIAFNADGTLVVVVPILPERGEGTWSTRGSILTWTMTTAGPDVDSLQPLDPPRTTAWSWSVSRDTLTISNPQVTFYYVRDAAAFEVQP